MHRNASIAEMRCPPGSQSFARNAGERSLSRNRKAKTVFVVPAESSLKMMMFSARDAEQNNKTRHIYIICQTVHYSLKSPINKQRPGQYGYTAGYYHKHQPYGTYIKTEMLISGEKEDRQSLTALLIFVLFIFCFRHCNKKEKML